MFGEMERHKREYERFIPEEARADKCMNCGACLAKCPQKIDIPSEMAKVAEYFK
jgi:predicted aldo/keto reductase-like oxidoreductase